MTQDKKPIFARSLNRYTGIVRRDSPPYCSDEINWGLGGTVYRRAWWRCYDENGLPIREMIESAVANFQPGTVVSIDIEEHGYNLSPVDNRHVEFVIECKRSRPDCKFGYYKTHGSNSNMLVYPPGSRNRIRMEENIADLKRLDAFVDFAAPQFYPSYAGQLPTSGQGSWLSSYYSDYGFSEWVEQVDWLLNEISKTQSVIYPYICPYSLQNGADGSYQTGYLQYFVPWFGIALNYLMQHELVSGVFFFDLHNSTMPTWDGPTQHWINELLVEATTRPDQTKPKGGE